MKRLQIMIEPEIDAALEREARRLGRSKASLIREEDVTVVDEPVEQRLGDDGVREQRIPVRGGSVRP